MPEPDATQPEPPTAAAPARGQAAIAAAGLRLALLQRASLSGLRFGGGAFWIAALAALLSAFALAWLVAEPPRKFDPAGLQSQGFGLLLQLLAAYGVARICGERNLFWSFAVLTLWASVLAGTVTAAIYFFAFPAEADVQPATYWLFYAGSTLWWSAILYTALTALHAGRPRLRLLLALLATAVTVGPDWVVPHSYLWTHDYYAEYQLRKRDEPSPLVAEEVFARQPELLDRALSQIDYGVPDRPDLYFVAFAPYGGQDVFLKEARYSTQLFDRRFGTQGRSLTLVNNRQTLGELPLATATNLEVVLEALGQRMDLDDDILFLFLTSHGSRDAELSVELDDLSFRPLTATALADALQASGIRWRVLVVSGCYSGSFLEALRNEHTLVMTAARADRTSFGCSDGADFTYFGRALFEQGLQGSRSFTQAFAAAASAVAAWENSEKRERSEPQIAVGSAVEAQLRRWQAGLPPEGLSGRLPEAP